MTNAYHQIAFTPAVQDVQTALGSRRAYAMPEWAERPAEVLGDAEREFLATRESFYMASTSETGWPYIQHRGGAPGFVRVLDDRTLGFADFRGNRQYVSLGNLRRDDRISLFFMDYGRRARLKMFARAEVIDATDPRFEGLAVEGYRGAVERGILLHVAAFDWNCPQHIPELIPLAEAQAATRVLGARIAELEQELAALRGG